MVFIVTFSFFVFLFFLIILLAILIKERRNLYSGIFLILTLASFAVFLVLIVFKYSEIILKTPILYSFITALSIFVILAVTIFPISVILLFFYSAFMIIIREKFSLRNLLLLGVGIGLTSYLLFWPRIAKFTYDYYVLNAIYVYVGLVILYFICLAVAYTASSTINLINLPLKKLDYIVVLGAGLIGERVTPLLARRIDKGIKLLKKHKNAKIIMSGGQGADEVIAEAVAMKNYALEQGVSEEKIILENKSTNTYENLKFSYALMENEKRFALVTNYYHTFRALILAKVLGLKCVGYGAKTKFYFTANAFVREFIGYLYLRRKLHIIILSILTFLFIFLIIAIEIYYYIYY